MYIYIYMWMVTPQDLHSPLPRDCAGCFSTVSFIHAVNTVNSDTIVLVAMCMQTVLLRVAGSIFV